MKLGDIVKVSVSENKKDRIGFLVHYSPHLLSILENYLEILKEEVDKEDFYKLTKELVKCSMKKKGDKIFVRRLAEAIKRKNHDEEDLSGRIERLFPED